MSVREREGGYVDEERFEGLMREQMSPVTIRTRGVGRLGECVD